MKIGICLLAALISMSAFVGVFAQPNPNCPGVPNDSPLIDAVPVLTKSVKHGQLYRIENGTNTMNIVNVFGSPYQMGYAAGELMPEWIEYNVDNMLVYGANYLFSKLESLSLPAFLIKIVKRLSPTKVLSTLLEWNYIVTIPYTNKRWIEEMKGMSDASGVPLMSIVHMNLFPELTQAACSMVGAWGDATTGNVVRQLRALDWSPDAPVNKYPLITIYHSTEKGSNVFANIGFVGFIGSITAFSAKGIALAEKQWWTREKVPITYYGYPWMYVFRDLAQFSNNLSDAIDTIFHAKRTQKVFIGIGSLEDNSFLGVQYSEKIVNVFNDKNYTAYSPAHPQMDGIVFFDKYVQPSDNACLGSVLSEGYGNIDTEFLFRNVTGLHETGNAQICVFDFISKDIWLAYSYGDDELAYQRSPMRIPLAPFFGSSFENPTVLVEA